MLNDKAKASFFDTCSDSDKSVCFTTLITAKASFAATHLEFLDRLVSFFSVFSTKGVLLERIGLV
ncbi:hypothetical protein A20_0394c [Streptococcus pyogenes A20]|nr:hypothetical protein A20_0394c [Streptococcus pyogenes A20]AKK70938.1 hypothetical protein SP5448_07795 [Streptococcus pyogenes]EPZ41881.1 hypothetical protein HMPREF1228_1425 [Streptococcus pyogenes GA41345]SDV81147.1 hypothetical protein ISR3_0250 [Streptococcus pyogenes]SDV89014.1 hypothetical protein ISR4_1124 [Streptococcus pyogenes]